MANSKTGSFPKLTAPGATAPVVVTAHKNIVFTYRVTNIDTTVVVRLEGTSDSNIGWVNLDPLGDTAQTANNTYAFTTSNKALTEVRFVFISETGGTNAEIEVSYSLNE